MKHLFFAMLLSVSAASFAQTGNYFLSHIAPDNKRFDNICFDIVQDQRGVLYFATQGGILEFDGSHWGMIEGKAAVYSLKISSSGNLFWSGAKGFGTVKVSPSGQEELSVMSDSTVTDIFQTLTTESAQFFVSENTIYIHNDATDKFSKISASDLTGTFVGLFEFSDKVYVNSDLGEIFVINGEQLTRASFGLPEGVIVSTCARHNDDYFIITNTNRIFVARANQRMKEVMLQDQAYADASVMINATWVNPQLVSIGTLRGGVMFIDPSSGNTQEIVNYSTGLPDNEVFALMRDRNQSIWVAHDYGFTRISPYLPFRSFSHYPGLTGNILCALSFQNTVYVGTSLGLFKLEKEELFDELVYYVDVEVREKKSNKKLQVAEEKPTPEVTPVQTQQETESKKRGFLRFLRKKKEATTPVPAEEKKETPAADAKVIPPTETKKKSPVYRREERTKKVLRSSQYVYKKIKGIDSKVSQLIEVRGRLIAAGLAGAFEVNNLEATAVLEDPIRFIYAPPGDEMLIASTYDNEIWTLLRPENKWESLPLLNDVDYEINFMFTGKENEVWLCAMDKIYRMELDGDQVADITALDLANAHTQQTIGIQLKDETMLANEEGFFRYDRTSNKIIRIDSMAVPLIYFAQDQKLWYHDDRNWNTVGAAGRQNNLHLLNLFNDLRYVSSDQAPENLWIISGTNELYRFYGERFTPYDAGYGLFAKSVRVGDKQVRNMKDIEITENVDVVSFSVVQPDYISAKSIEYRYFLKGLHKEWSEWSTGNSQLDFPYLPPGDYSLQVQSRNIFGKVEDMQALSFEVLPPYWKRSWFYALEFFMFAGLVVLSFRLSTRYRIISRLLSLLTIILLIQFIQTIIGATFAAKNSPVTDFFIQVIVALLILPVEGYLRKLMLQSVDHSAKFYSFIKPEPKSAEEEAEKS